MAIKLIDSFESNNTVNDEVRRYPYSEDINWIQPGGRFPNSTNYVNVFGGFNNDGLIKRFDTTHATWIMGWSWRRNLALGGILAGVWDEPNQLGGTQQVRLDTLADGTIEARRGDNTLLGSSAAGVITGDNTWFSIEVKFVISNTTGSVVVKIDGTTVLDLTNQDTQNSSNAFANTVQFGQGNIDEIVVLDGSGTSHNDFIGEFRIETLRPTANGTTNNFTPSAGSNWQNVDEAESDDDTTYNESNTVGHIDLFQVEDLTLFEAGDTIEAVQVSDSSIKDNVGSRTLRHLLRSGTTNYEGSDKKLTTNWDKHFFHIWEEDPDTAAAWTQSGVNAVEIGVKVQA